MFQDPYYIMVLLIHVQNCCPILSGIAVAVPYTFVVLNVVSGLVIQASLTGSNSKMDVVTKPPTVRKVLPN